ncbi:MAG: hypothetical protein Devi2KO_37920 [Devosia indica]
MTVLRSEVVSVGHHMIGRIRQTNRGFELFDSDDRYLATAVTLPEARRFLFEQHRDKQDTAA